MAKKEMIISESCNYIAAFLTMRCNLNCSFCLNNLEKSEEFNRNKFIEISGKQWVDGLNRIISRPEVPVTFSGGEPFLHKDFIYIINNLKLGLSIDILTNLQWGRGVDRFVEKVNPKRLRRDSPYASIRVSYHPEQMNADRLVKNVKKMQDAGFSIGIWSVLFPSPAQLSAINQMQFRCKDAGIEFRLKEFTGEYKRELYGDYSRYPGSILQNSTKSCLCKTSELLIGPNADIYRCHRDLYSEEHPIRNLLENDIKIVHKLRECNNYGQCHPCDVKVKTNYKQELGHTSVEIKDIENK